MRRFTPPEIEVFLRLLDAELKKRHLIIAIGGAAIGLLYVPTHATADLDVVPVSDASFWAAVERARSKMDVPLPVQSAGIFQAPYSFEDRCRPLTVAGLRRLAVVVPEAHDLALMKIARGLTHDFQAIEDIHRKSALDLETLIARYDESKAQLIGSPETFELSFLALVERLFGTAQAEDVEKQLKGGAATDR